MMSAEYNAPMWEYVDGKPKRGRPLLLLSFDELILSNKFLQNKIKRSSWLQKPNNYNCNLADKVANTYVSETMLMLRKLIDIRLIDDESIALINNANSQF